MIRLLLIVFVIWYFAKYYNLNNECEVKDCENCPFPQCERKVGEENDKSL